MVAKHMIAGQLCLCATIASSRGARSQAAEQRCPGELLWQHHVTCSSVTDCRAELCWLLVKSCWSITFEIYEALARLKGRAALTAAGG